MLSRLPCIGRAATWGLSMTEHDYAQALDELDSLLNDPNVALQPSLVWELLDKVSGRPLAVPEK
jgi:hypothetical protein